jgi:hypothetical protein
VPGATNGSNTLLALAAASLGVLSAPHASALEATPKDAPTNTPRKRVAYDTPRACPERSDWLRRVRSRLPPLLQTHPLLRTLSVRIQKMPGEEMPGDGGAIYEGELIHASSIELPDSRRVRGGSCDEVLDALAFIGALGLEGVAANQHETGPLEVGLDPEHEPPSRASPERQEVGVDAPSPAVVPPARRRLRLGAVGFGLLQGGIAPGQSLALGVALRAAWSAPGWQPLLSLGAYSSLPEDRRVEGGGRVRYEHWSLHAVACPWRFPETGSWGVRPCAELDVGRSRGQGFDIDDAERHSTPWLATGAQLRTELTLWNRLELALSVAAVVPFVRSHFFLYPGVERFDTPALGLRAGSFATLLF